MQNDVVFFVPFNANAVGALHKGLYFELVQIPNLAAESYKFWGAIQVRAENCGKGMKYDEMVACFSSLRKTH